MAGKSSFSWLAGRNKIQEILESADQNRLQVDLRTFFGPHAELYLAVYEKMRERGGRIPMTWNWTVFFTVFPWFFYRKMYGIGAVVILLPIVFSLVLGSTGGAGGLASLALFAKSFYVFSALHRVFKADALGLEGAEREDYLRRAGGVSVVAGTLAGILFAALAGLVIFSVYIASAHPELLR